MEKNGRGRDKNTEAERINQMNRMTKSGVRMLEQHLETICREYEACGMAVAVVDHTGETKYEHFIGYRDGENQLPLNEDTIFGIASVTKSFTCMAIMQLQEQGKLDVHDLVSKYVPDFTGKNQPNLHIWQLMCHSGGFFPLPRILVGPVAESMGLTEEKDGDFAYTPALAEEGIRLVAGRLDDQTAEQGLIGKPGEYFSYCNDGFGVLSDIVRRVSGMSFAQYVKENILLPLGMDRSSCEFVKPSLDENGAVLYERRDGVMCHDRDYHNNAFVIHGGGSLKSTLSDMKKYVTMYLREGIGANGTRVLSESGIHEMLRPKMKSGPHADYCFGLTAKEVSGLPVYEHSGDLPGVSSCICFSYEADAAVIVLCNTTDVPASCAAEAVMRVYCGGQPAAAKVDYKEEPWSRETMADAVGVYDCGEGYGVVIYEREDGGLGIRADGNERIAIPVSQNLAMLSGKYADGFVKLCRKSGKVFAVQYGSRMLPKTTRR